MKNCYCFLCYVFSVNCVSVWRFFYCYFIMCQITFAFIIWWFHIVVYARKYATDLPLRLPNLFGRHFFFLSSDVCIYLILEPFFLYLYSCVNGRKSINKTQSNNFRFDLHFIWHKKNDVCHAEKNVFKFIWPVVLE